VREDFDRFLVYSAHIRYLQTRDGILPNEVLEDYMCLFPNTPILPRVRSINILLGPPNCLRYFLRSSTPAENEPSASTSTLRSLSTYRYPYPANIYMDERESLARDLTAFQRSNGKLGGGLEAFRDFTSFAERGFRLLIPTGWTSHEGIESAFAFSPETVGQPVHRLRRLEVTHFLHEIPAFFGRVVRMQALEHLKITIAYGTGEFENIEEPPKPSYEGIRHSASSLELEGTWDDLYSAMNLCAPPSWATQFRAFRLRYYLTELPTQAVVPLLDLPSNIIPPDHLDALTIDLLDCGTFIPKYVNDGIDAAVRLHAFQPLLRYTQMVKLHLELPFNILLDIEFLRVLAVVMGETLRHFVILRRLNQQSEDGFKPVLTADDLPTVVGVIMPRLEALGLDVSYDEVSLSAKCGPLGVIIPVANALRWNDQPQ
jgi:hypothetical protein